MNRPKFELAWAAARKIYDPDNSSAKVAKVIGGMVARNINARPPANLKNTCAVRMSYILNYSGLKIPTIQGQTVSGADHRQYFYRVPVLISYLTKIWGKPDLIVPYPSSGVNSPLTGKRGIILFEVTGFTNARGHATLWDGTICYDHCYFNEPNVTYKTDRANFWSLP